ncbi:MAG TPA: hypothetical protein VNO22_04305 [Planctomycetota bacterium]|nr:hypothetical protein [Planctomycetota bacterium]
MIANSLAWSFLLLSPLLGSPRQEDPAELKRRILEKVRQKLTEERAAILRRVERIVEEELSRSQPPAPKPPAPPPAGESDARVRELERRLRALEEQKEILETEIAKSKRLALDEPVRKEAQAKGPHDEEEASELFDQALEAHQRKDFDASVRLFKRIYYQFPKEPIGATSAYNVACGYALAGKKDEALDWLEIALAAGFRKIDHLRKDPDLDSLRQEKRYRRLLTDR